eukprot:GILI01006910.1.p1 GENE.GILI01006910.1~~GILI01006910.1.p1  ORF type:complete len:366 (-),score=114.35 GILI01006910.1:82-1146(-)
MAGLDDLRRQFSQLQRDIEELESENMLLSSYSDHHLSDPAEQEALRSNTASNSKSLLNSRKKSNVEKKLPMFLSAEQKHDLATSELEIIGKETEALRQTHEKNMNALRAALEEADQRIAETKKDIYEFRRDIMVGAENPRTGKTMAEKYIRYVEDKLREKDALIEKLKLKNATLQAHVGKTEGQLKQKEEQGEDLKYIDYHQLKIEHKQYLAKIEEANAELLDLKLTTGKTVQDLNNLKSKLHQLTEESQWLGKEIGSRRETLNKIGEDITRVTDERDAAMKENRRLKLQQQMTGDMPQVLDYVNQKQELYELEKDLISWERKMGTVEMAAKRAKSIIRQAQGMGPGSTGRMSM